jgi:hypothetical protein
MLLAPPRPLKRRPPLAELRRTWQHFSADLHDPHFELDAEQFASILSTFKSLRDAGDTFDPMLVALMAVLERQAADTLDGFEDDSDSDQHADGQTWGQP